MTRYLLDTNVILRLSNPSDKQHNLVVQAVATLLRQGNKCYLTPQVLIELWVVATRPADKNGLGWLPQQASNIIKQLLQRFPMVEENPEVFFNWLTLVTTNQIKGKRTHDIRIVAVMLSSEIDHILTLNPKDFARIPGITVVHPQNIVDKTDAFE